MPDRYVADDSLGYLRSRTPYVPGAPFILDDFYCLAQLPLVRPEHPKAIDSIVGKPYVGGRHATVWSVVLPIDAAALENSGRMTELDQTLRDSSFASCIAWDMLDRRRDRLHATVCGGLARGLPPSISADQLARLGEVGPISLELRGLFSGTMNIGRLYLRVYPEDRGGRNALHTVQQILQRPCTDVFLVGIYNLVDDLSPAQADELQRVLTDWWHAVILRWSATELWLLGARDDLVLDADPPRRLPLRR